MRTQRVLLAMWIDRFVNCIDQKVQDLGLSRFGAPGVQINRLRVERFTHKEDKLDHDIAGYVTGDSLLPGV